MGVQDKSGRKGTGAVVLAATEMVVAACLAIVLLSPAQAQFWSPYGAPRRPPAPIQQQQQPRYNQQYNPFGGFGQPFGGFGQPAEPPRPQAPPDNSHAPAPQSHKTDVPPTMSIVVMGDAMADWLGYGLEDAFSERPEVGITRKHRTASSLVRYDTRREVDWAQTAREIIAAEKPKFIVMMVGINDHQAIRERAPTPSRATPPAGKPGAAPGSPTAPGQSAETTPPPTEDVPDAENPETPLIAAEPGRSNSATGPFEFHTDQWEAAYIKRIDATIAAMKSGGVPVFWVGLPAQRGSKATADASYLDELYRGRAEKAGIVYVDIWDGFVDEQGRYSPQGPDFEGQIRRLRSADGVYFTKAGARKLAHYVEREIDRSVAMRAVPVALPIEPAPAGAKAGGPSGRPLVGPVVPLTRLRDRRGASGRRWPGNGAAGPRGSIGDPRAHPRRATRGADRPGRRLQLAARERRHGHHRAHIADSGGRGRRVGGLLGSVADRGGAPARGAVFAERLRCLTHIADSGGRGRRIRVVPAAHHRNTAGAGRGYDLSAARGGWSARRKQTQGGEEARAAAAAGAEPVCYTEHLPLIAVGGPVARC